MRIILPRFCFASHSEVMMCLMLIQSAEMCVFYCVLKVRWTEHRTDQLFWWNWTQPDNCSHSLSATPLQKAFEAHDTSECPSETKMCNWKAKEVIQYQHHEFEGKMCGCNQAGHQSLMVLQTIGARCCKRTVGLSHS